MESINEFWTLYREYKTKLRYPEDSNEYAEGLTAQAKAQALLTDDALYRFIVLDQFYRIYRKMKR